VNSVDLDFDPHISSDRETLYFTSTRTGGGALGGQDLWVTTRTKGKAQTVKESLMRKVMMVGVLVGVGGFLFAEGSQPRVEGSTADALLAEVRALRAEVTQVTSAGIRTQVLVARLQLQEQRVLNAARQLAEAQKNSQQSRAESTESEQGSGNSRTRRREQWARGERYTSRRSPRRELRSNSSKARKSSCRTREKELLRAVSDEQFRWTELIDRLDALERGLPAGLSH
jgi:hypothetical protein